MLVTSNRSSNRISDIKDSKYLLDLTLIDQHCDIALTQGIYAKTACINLMPKPCRTIT